MSKMIFVVDDNDANLTVAASALEEDFRVLTMPSAERMFSLLGKKRPDMILLDIEMPEMGGFEAISKLKGQPEWNDIPVVFVTGHIDDAVTSNASKSGALDVIGKPFAPGALLRRVKELLD